jgi:hypothetical protein
MQKSFGSEQIEMHIEMKCNLQSEEPVWCAFGISTGYGLDDQGLGVQVLGGSRMFSRSQGTDQL